MDARRDESMMSSGKARGDVDPIAAGSASSGAWFRFTVDGRYLDAGGSLLGVTARGVELAGRRLEDVVSAAIAEQVHLGIATASRAGSATRRMRVERDDGPVTIDVAFVKSGADEVVAFASAAPLAQRRLVESEQRFRTLLELVNDGVWMLDADGRTTFATPRMAQILGCSLDELLQRSPLDFLSEEQQRGFAARQERRRRGAREPTGAFWLRGLDGREIETRLSASPIYDAGGTYIGAVAVVSDETPRRTAERELAEAQRQLGAVAEAHDDVFYVGEIGPDGSYHELFSGPGSQRLLGADVPPTERFGSVWDAAVHPDDRAAYEAMNEALAAGEAAALEYRLVGLDGVVRWVHDRARPRQTRDGRVVFDGVISDISERRAQTDALAAALAEVRAAHADAERLARTDALTGLFNRRHFEAALGAELARARRQRHACGVVLVDIDHFKRLNDQYGHETGDRVLQAIATRLRGVLRPYDVLARWGGEEFIILVAAVANEGALRRVGQSLLDAVAQAPIVLADGQPLRVTASAGAALAAGGDDIDRDALIDDADRCLYAAKRRGRDRLVLHRELTPSDTAPEEPEAIRLAEGLAIAASIREAIPPLHCQQVADLAELVARHLQLSDAMILRCRLAGWLHDVGKLAIPDQILNRTGELDDDERNILRRHAEIGAAILQGLPSLRDAAAGVRHHHERYDGAGYPDRLVRDQIPLEARIVAVCDAYSAITAGRPHHPALDHDQAVAQLDNAAGRSLDPALVKALKHAVDSRTPRPTP